MSREIHCIQGSPEWYALRRGIPTASQFGRIVTPAKGEYAKGSETYAAELIAEALGWQSGFQGTPDTERGNYLEREAVNWLAFRHGIEARESGFWLADSGRYGASPDGITTDGRPLEVKCPALHTFIKWRIAGGLPEDHKAQVHGEMILTGADEGLFVAYADSKHVDNMLVIVKRDDFTRRMEEHLVTFCDRLATLQRELLGDEAGVIFPYLNVQGEIPT
jgi:hypothetical protein